jgi:hypothetical protein
MTAAAVAAFAAAVAAVITIAFFGVETTVLRAPCTPLARQRAFPLARLPRAIGAVVVVVVVIAVGSIATAAAACHYEWRVFVLLVLERRNTRATEFTHFAPPIACALAVVADLL